MANQPQTTTWDERAIAGLAVWNGAVRYEYSPPTSFWANTQRAEFSRILAECYQVGERNVRTWFSLNQRQTPFLRKDLPQDILLSRIILAGCLQTAPAWAHDDRVSIQRVKGVAFNPESPSLRELLIEPNPYDDAFQWQFSSYEWNDSAGTTDPEINQFCLIWIYGVFSVPSWLPSNLSPVPKFDSNPFGAYPAE